MVSEEEMKRFEDNFLLIRKAVGWSAEEFGDRIGVTRQAINNLENKKNKLPKNFSAGIFGQKSVIFHVGF